MKIKGFLVSIAVLPLLMACGPLKEAKESEDRFPSIFPDYTQVAIPYNMAPLNFEVKDAESIRADFSVQGQCLFTVSGDRDIQIPTDKWKEMLEQQKGKKIEVQVSVWNATHPEGVRYNPFTIHIAPDAIDEWIAYRLIEPGYEGWNVLGIYQRRLTTFEEKEIVTNRDDESKCINCHSFADYAPDRMLFHVRGQNGGTALWMDGKLTKLELDKIGVKKNGTYPMWHPKGRFVAFSSNVTHQSFRSVGDHPIEVYDLESDLIVYDTQTKQVLTSDLFMGKESWETFPAWAPDGKSLYFCTARPVDNMPITSPQLHYNLCRIAFDESTGRFGQQIDTIDNAERAGGSISFPRISPNGEYLLSTVAACATFPIWHKEADLLLTRLSDGELLNASILNSDETESYHSWSSNGRWILFSSRRLDGRYTRLYVSWMDETGKLHKPFLLPQQSPKQNLLRMKSYNIPEFIRGEVTLPQSDLKELFFSPQR